MISPEPSAEIDAVFDPLSDILFSAIAVLFVALMAIAPALKTRANDAASPSKQTRPSTALYAGRPIALLVATPDGIRFGDNGTAFAPLDTLDSDARLLAFLAKSGDDRLTLLIEPGGEEAAFVLDPVLAARHVAAILQMRLLAPCALANGALDLNTCLAGVAEPVSR